MVCKAKRLRFFSAVIQAKPDAVNTRRVVHFRLRRWVSRIDARNLILAHYPGSQVILIAKTL